MAIIQPIIHAEINPNNPVKEICEVISALAPYHPGQEERILLGVKEAIDKRLQELAGRNEEPKKKDK